MRLTFDFECSTSNKGNPFDQTNQAVCLGLKHNDEKPYVYFNMEGVQRIFNEATLLIGFNIKFDLHWLRRIGCSYNGRLWDCQLAEFILGNQSHPYPALNDCAEEYDLPVKDDRVKQYWEQGIDTKDIPKEILEEYCKQDVDLTYQVYLKQLELFKTTHKHKYKLFLLSMADTAVLAEMEYNGMCWDEGLSSIKSSQCGEKLDILQKEILGEYSHIPINLNSGDHLSALLYGGTISHEFKVPVGEFKTGAKIGQTRYKWLKEDYVLPRRFEPLPKSELKKEGFWSTDEQTLRSLKGSKQDKQILVALEDYAKTEKLKGTYYDGYNALRLKMNWPVNKLHGQYNQVVARTGRLSSSQPNLQNISPEAKQLFYSRFS